LSASGFSERNIEEKKRKKSLLRNHRRVLRVPREMAAPGYAGMVTGLLFLFCAGSSFGACVTTSPASCADTTAIQSVLPSSTGDMSWNVVAPVYLKSTKDGSSVEDFIATLVAPQNLSAIQKSGSTQCKNLDLIDSASDQYCFFDVANTINR
jgi:hypothetical protein